MRDISKKLSAPFLAFAADPYSETKGPEESAALEKIIMKLPILAVTLAGLVATAQAETMLGVSWSGATYSVDSTTGNASLLAASSGFNNYNSLAYHAGMFLTVSGSTLVSVDPGTGNGTSVATLSQGDIRGLASFGGRLYGTANVGSADSLVSIDTGTGVVTTIGAMGHTGVQGLAANSSGLFAWDIFDGLMTVNAGTGGTTVLGGPGELGIQTIEFLGDGSMVGGRDELYSINTSTGALSLIGGTGMSDIRGLAVVPEPITLLAFAAGLAGLAKRRRSR